MCARFPREKFSWRYGRALEPGSHLPSARGIGSNQFCIDMEEAKELSVSGSRSGCFSHTFWEFSKGVDINEVYSLLTYFVVLSHWYLPYGFAHQLPSRFRFYRRSRVTGRGPRRWGHDYIPGSLNFPSKLFERRCTHARRFQQTARAERRAPGFLRAGIGTRLVVCISSTLRIRRGQKLPGGKNCRGQFSRKGGQFWVS